MQKNNEDGSSSLFIKRDLSFRHEDRDNGGTYDNLQRFEHDAEVDAQGARTGTEKVADRSGPKLVNHTYTLDLATGEYSDCAGIHEDNCPNTDGAGDQTGGASALTAPAEANAEEPQAPGVNQANGDLLGGGPKGEVPRTDVQVGVVEQIASELPPLDEFLDQLGQTEPPLVPLDEVFGNGPGIQFEPGQNFIPEPSNLDQVIDGVGEGVVEWAGDLWALVSNPIATASSLISAGREAVENTKQLVGEFQENPASATYGLFFRAINGVSSLQNSAQELLDAPLKDKVKIATKSTLDFLTSKGAGKLLKAQFGGKPGNVSGAGDIDVPKKTGTHSKNLGEALEDAGYPRPPGGYQAGHLVPTNVFSSRSKAVQDAIKSSQNKFDKFLGPEARDKAINGFWAKAGHAGTHTDEFFLALGKAFEGVNSPAGASRALDGIWQRVEAGEFVR